MTLPLRAYAPLTKVAFRDSGVATITTTTVRYRMSYIAWLGEIWRFLAFPGPSLLTCGHQEFLADSVFCFKGPCFDEVPSNPHLRKWLNSHENLLLSSKVDPWKWLNTHKNRCCRLKLPPACTYRTPTPNPLPSQPAGS